RVERDRRGLTPGDHVVRGVERLDDDVAALHAHRHLIEVNAELSAGDRGGLHVHPVDRDARVGGLRERIVARRDHDLQLERALTAAAGGEGEGEGEEPLHVFSPQAACTAAAVAPSMRTVFLREVSPRTIDTARAGTPSVLARKARSASLAA